MPTYIILYTSDYTYLYKYGLYENIIYSLYILKYIQCTVHLGMSLVLKKNEFLSFFSIKTKHLIENNSNSLRC